MDRSLVYTSVIRQTVAAVCAAGCFCATAVAQDPPAAVFEVVSIKPRIGEPVYAQGPSAPDRFTWRDVTLSLLIRNAYDLFDFQLIGGPDCIHSRRWDIDAKAPRAVLPPERRQMVRRLLQERFALRTHTETRVMPIYELVLARRDGRLGPKIRPATVDCRPFLTGARPRDESPKNADGIPICMDGGSFRGGLLTPMLHGRPISDLVRTLEAALQRKVVDRTGLTGIYDIELSYVDQSFVGKGIGSDDDGPALLTALQEQLGLRLQSTRGPVDVLVVDTASEPTTN